MNNDEGIFSFGLFTVDPCEGEEFVRYETYLGHDDQSIAGYANLTSGDCINSIDVQMTNDYIQRLLLRTIKGDSTWIGLHTRDPDSVDEQIAFGADNCLVGISTGLTLDGKVHEIKFWYQEFSMDLKDDGLSVVCNNSGKGKIIVIFILLIGAIALTVFCMKYIKKDNEDNSQ